MGTNPRTRLNKYRNWDYNLFVVGANVFRQCVFLTRPGRSVATLLDAAPSKQIRQKPRPWSTLREFLA